MPDVIESEVIATVAPETMLVVLRLISAPDVPTDISTIRVPPDVCSEANVAVAVAAAVALVIALAVATPPEAAANAVALNGSVASTVLPDNAVSGLVGCVPE